VRESHCPVISHLHYPDDTASTAVLHVEGQILHLLADLQLELPLTASATLPI